VVFFLVACSLFPLGVQPGVGGAAPIAPGIVWVCALLSAMLSLGSLYGSDYADGSLEQMLVSGQSMVVLVLAKALAHWLMTAVLDPGGAPAGLAV